MDEKKASGHAVALAVVALVAGVLIGIVGAGVYDMRGLDDGVETDPAASEEAFELKMTLRSQFTEQARLSQAMLLSVYTGRDDTDEASEILDQNSEELAEMLEIYYGEDTAAEFLQAWQAHNDNLTEYVASTTRRNNQAAIAAAEDKLVESIDALALWMAANTDAEEDVWKASLTEYTDELIQVVSSYAAGNYRESYEAGKGATSALTGMSDLIADAIVERNPGRF